MCSGSTTTLNLVNSNVKATMMPNSHSSHNSTAACDTWMLNLSPTDSSNFGVVSTTKGASINDYWLLEFPNSVAIKSYLIINTDDTSVIGSIMGWKTTVGDNSDVRLNP